MVRLSLSICVFTTLVTVIAVAIPYWTKGDVIVDDEWGQTTYTVNFGLWEKCTYDLIHGQSWCTYDFDTARFRITQVMVTVGLALHIVTLMAGLLIAMGRDRKAIYNFCISAPSAGGTSLFSGAVMYATAAGTRPLHAGFGLIFVSIAFSFVTAVAFGISGARAHPEPWERPNPIANL